ncbi:hypothetical protein [Pseudoroseomonas ludipueritiae]|uniref:DUF1508 domain-containing protein n=1 Tax=Pseudoroseomonas ludipueritiae TaxID=198093 RepID=A0ABR7R1I9_9PROT|nr:hypothetical protein [Pseudoroseomonas ludipueritiae]MBC9175599.1 hypothetical protein [Pseudoroseomonas ludipueritiae]MCG7359696.1 hypothetical protein [Roseomonas sp. ACRSG]
MPLIRIEPVRDERSGRYFLEIYNPHDAPAPYVTTQPRYQSAAAAENDLVAILAAAASSARNS